MDNLIDRIVKETGSKEYKPLYKKAIRILGEDRVNGELAALQSEIREGKLKDHYINHKGKYFTKMLKEIMPEEDPGENKEPIPEDTYLQPTQQDLFSNLRPKDTPKDKKGNKKQMIQPYYPGQIPYPTAIGQEFFTTSKNKNKSDTVKYMSITADGQKLEVPMIRGKYRPTGESIGILTVQHGKVFVALIKLWTENGSQLYERSDGSVICCLEVSARELADTLSWKKFGGNQSNSLKDLLFQLKNYPFYLDLEKTDLGLKGYGFSLLGEVSIIDKAENPEDQGKITAETIFSINFSTSISNQLNERAGVSRSDSLITMRSELAWKTRLYIESRLLSNRENRYNITLNNLISDLQLQKRKWQKYKSKRKQIFDRAIKEINGAEITDGRIIKANIVPTKDKSDYKLLAYLENSKQEQLKI